jgi:signal transduction histidine kinase
MRIESLTSRLLVGALVWLALMLTAGGVVLTLAFRDTVEKGFVERLDSMLRAMVATVEVNGDTVTFTRPVGEPRFERVFSGWYWQIADDGGLLLRSRSLWDQALPVHTPEGDGPLEISSAAGPEGAPLVVVERDLIFPDRARPVHVLIAADRREIDHEVSRFRLLLTAASALMGVGLLVAVVIQVRFGLRPLKLLADELEEVRRGTRPRLGRGHPTEIAPLAEAMNAVLDHDAALIERARTHVGNLAHGLKTPLSVLKAESQGHDPDPVVVAEQVTAMDRLVQHHLGRAAAAASAHALGARLAVAPVLADLGRVLPRIHADKDVTFDCRVEGDPSFPGERQDLEEILGNLMDNAGKWAASMVRITAAESEGGLRLTVEDDGPGMAEEQVAEASRRGARFDEMTPGWGLGLSIVADLVALHGGSLSFGRSPLGGLAVTVKMPLSKDFLTSPNSR